MKGRLGIALAAFTSVLLLAGGFAWAATSGLLNQSFEQGSGSQLDDWQVRTYSYSGSTRSQVYGPGEDPVPCVAGDPYGICVVNGSDTFMSHSWQTDSDTEVTVPVLDGSKMVRLAGPFRHNAIRQMTDGFAVEQTFTVQQGSPVVNLNYNLFTYDYSGFDELSLLVRVTSPGEQPISERIQGGFSSGTDLKTTGWRSADIDLSDYVGQSVKLEVELRGTSDTLFGSWAYLDAGTAPEPVIDAGQVGASVPAKTPQGENLSFHKYVDESSNLVYYTLPSSQVQQFANGCVPMDIDIPLNPGQGSISNVVLYHAGSSYSTSHVSANLWRAHIPCVSNGFLSVGYTLTEGSVSQDFIIPLGGVTLIDPQGVIYDKQTYNNLLAQGKSETDARNGAALTGATVTLQRSVGGEFVNVLSGDPGISPNINPEVTGADGLFQWDVSDGNYRVKVTKPGYRPVTSRVVTVPPPVLDLHIPLLRQGGPELAPTITSSPGAATLETSASFAFAKNSNEAQEVNGFECSLDGAAFESCSSPKSYSGLSVGAHGFSVRAANSDGVGPAATYSWQVNGANTSTVRSLGPLKVTPGKKAVKRSRSATFTAKVSSVGNATADGIRVCVAAPSKLVSIKKSCRTIGSLASGDTGTASFKVTVKKKAKKGKKAVLKFVASGMDIAARRAQAKVKVK